MVVSLVLILALAATSAAPPPSGAAPLGVAETRREPVVGGCEGCEAAFDGRPKVPPAMAQLAPSAEPGVRLRLSGIVRDRLGRPRSGIVLYAHQTDRTGVYPPTSADAGAAARRHGRLRAWAMTDSEGRYGFDTIRPGSYPGEAIPQHIHLQVIEPGCATYYIDDVVFADDPLLDEDFRRRLPMRGGNGEVIPVRDGDRWLASRDIDLGRNIPGYACPDKAG